MKVLIVPDLFKGTLTSKEVCEVIKERVRCHFPLAEAVAVPAADGGEGSVGAFLTALGGKA